MPTYNRLSHIQRQTIYFINELKNVDNSLVEVIISNNASSDGTKEYLEDFEGRYSWLSINNNKENLGAYGNMILLLNMARGKYVWIPGDDDYLKIGLVSTVLSILNDKEPSYIYLSRRTLNEKSKHIQLEDKRHNIEYDRPISINYSQLKSLINENYGDLKFQTSSIFITENAKKYYIEAQSYPLDIQANCHSLFKSIRSMQEGLSYFISDICVLNGMDVSWGDSMIHYYFEADPQFVLGLAQFGIKENDCRKIAKRQRAAALLGCITQPPLFKKWKETGFVGFSLNLIPTVLFLSFRKVVRMFGLSKSHIVAEVNIKDFAI